MGGEALEIQHLIYLEGDIKSQAITYFVAQFSSPVEERTPIEWSLSVDGTSNIKGSGTRIVLEELGNILIEEDSMFVFTSNNNQVEYEALITGMISTLEMRASRLKAKSDSQLVTNHVSRSCQAKVPQQIRYLQKV